VTVSGIAVPASASSLPSLGGRVVHLEDPAFPARTVGEGVQAGAEDDVLVDAGHRGEPVLGVAAAGGHGRPRTGEHGMVAMQAVVADELLGTVTQKLVREGVGEDHRRLVDDEVGRTRRGGHESRVAGNLVIHHADEATLAFAYHITIKKLS
jgi:hypothetical protein